MNKYPLWKYAIIAIAIVVSAIYAAPNLFGEVPAVQVSPQRASFKIDAAMVKDLQAALTEAKTPYTDMEQTAEALRFRFADTDTQLLPKGTVKDAR